MCGTIPHHHCWAMGPAGASWAGQGAPALESAAQAGFQLEKTPRKTFVRVEHETAGAQRPSGAQSTAEIKCSFGLTWVIYFFSDVQLSSKFTSADWIGTFHVLFLNYMLHMLQHEKFDFSNANKWLQNWPLVNHSPAAFPCNYFAREFNLQDMKVLLAERAAHNDP